MCGVCVCVSVSVCVRVRVRVHLVKKRELSYVCEGLYF